MKRTRATFEAESIEPFLTAAAGTPLKKKPKAKASLVLAHEEAAYGEAFSHDLATLVRLQETRALPRVGTWSLFRGTRSFAKSKGPALRDGVDLVGPLSALYPLADNHGSDRVFATLRPAGDPRSWIYLFEGEESESLQRTHFSIAHFIHSHALVTDDVEDPLFGAEDEASSSFAKQQGASTITALEDPLVLFERSRWLLRALAEDGEFVTHAHGKRVPGLAAWEKEKRLLGDTPHLALYWLLAHWLAGNTAELTTTLEATKATANRDVLSVRRWVDGRSREGFYGQVREQLPARMRSKDVSAKATKSTGLSGVDPMAAAPDDLRLHQRTVQQMARTSDATFRAWVTTYDELVKGVGSHRKEEVALQTAWASAIDERMLVPLLGLVRRSFAYPKQLDPRALFWIIPALGRLGPKSAYRELVLSTLLSVPVKKIYDARIVQVVEALAAFDDPRALKWLEASTKRTLTGNFAMSAEVFGASVDALARRAPDKASAFIEAVLAKTDRNALTLHAHAARAAGKRNLSRAFAALATAFPSSRALNRATIGRALAELDPKRARPLFVAAIERPIADESTGTVSLRVGSRSYDVVSAEAATLLPGLRILEPTNLSLQAASKALRRRKASYWSAYVDA